MKKGFYIRLAGEGISKNRKLYFPYILTCICMIMMYYIVSFLSISKELASIRGGEMLQGLLSMGVFVVAVFALIFLYYTNSFLIRKRKKELGLYNILGMGKRNLVRILLWENILTAVISLVIGIVFGILFSKLAELLAIKLLDGATGFGVHIEMKPILMTVGLFLAIFLLIMIRMLVSVYKLRPIEMLRSENVGEKTAEGKLALCICGSGDPCRSILSGCEDHRSDNCDACILSRGCYGDHCHIPSVYCRFGRSLQAAAKEQKVLL